MAILSQVVRFVLPPFESKASEFLKLRQRLAKSQGILDQFFGYVIPVEGAGLPVRDHEMCWVVSMSSRPVASFFTSTRKIWPACLRGTTTPATDCWIMGDIGLDDASHSGGIARLLRYPDSLPFFPLPSL